MAPGVCVLIPTIGRAAQLRRCLASLQAGSRTPDETVVAAQGAWEELAGVVGEFPDLRIRVVRDEGVGRGRALNAGLRAVTADVVLVTDDDCTVAEDWIATAIAALDAQPGCIVTGRVLTHGDASKVPALKTFERAERLAGPAAFGRLAGGNFAARKADLRRLDGFDERIVPAAEDNELCYRWLQAGGCLYYEPAMLIWHDDWRSDPALRAVFANYGAGQGAFYGKYLRAGDLRFVVLVARDAVAALARLIRSRGQGDVRSGWFPGMLRGLRAALTLPADPVPAGWRPGRRPWLRDWMGLRAAAVRRRMGG